MRPFEDFANLFVLIFTLRFAILRLLRAGLLVVGELVLDLVEVSLQVLTLLRFHLNTGGWFLSLKKRLQMMVVKVVKG